MIRSLTRPVTTRISEAGTGASPVRSGTRRWAIAPFRVAASMTRAWCWRWGGKKSTMRLIVSVASRVWTGESTRGPVSPAGGGVDGGEDEVAGLGRREGSANGLLVAHLADQDHVGVLAQDAAHRPGEAFGVRADFALVDDRAFVFVQVLDRVLEGDDVIGPGAVDVVDHRRQRRALARAGGAGDEDDPALLFGQLGHHLRQPQLLDGADVEGDRAADDRDRAALPEGVDAET